MAQSSVSTQSRCILTTNDSMLCPATSHLIIWSSCTIRGETVDTSDLEQTLWPRAAAIAERLWSPKPTDSSATGPSPAWCIRNSAQPGAQPKGTSPYYCINNTAAVLPRLEAFRCYLNRRGVLAAPVLNKLGRSAPPRPGSCYEQ